MFFVKNYFFIAKMTCFFRKKSIGMYLKRVLMFLLRLFLILRPKGDQIYCRLEACAPENLRY